MRSPRLAVACFCLLAAGLLVLGCGGSDDPEPTTAEVQDRPAPPASDFPSAEGRTLFEVLESTSGPANLVVSPSSEVFYTGKNRYAFGVFEMDRTQVPDADVALYFAKVPPSESTLIPSETSGATGEGGPIKGSGGGEESTAPPTAPAEALDQPAVGPFPAKVESLVTEPAFRAQTTSNDPDAALAIYTTEIDFPSEGEWRIAALIKDGEKLTATLLPSAVVGQYTDVPRVGARPPAIDTPTRDDVSDLSELTTRVPPDTQNEENFADVLGRKPVVLLFATPQFCQSRVCGPVVDVAEQVKESYGDEVAFIHMEIFNENDPAQGVRPQVRAFNLPSEPWVFVIDGEGMVSTAIEGAFSVAELERAVQEVAP